MHIYVQWRWVGQRWEVWSLQSSVHVHNTLSGSSSRWDPESRRKEWMSTRPGTLRVETRRRRLRRRQQLNDIWSMDGWMDAGQWWSQRRLAVLPSPGTTDRPTVMHHHDARRREIRRVSSAIIPSPAAATTTATSYY